MKMWFVSLNGAITLSVIALLTFLARVTFLDALFVMQNQVLEDQPGTVALLMLGWMAFVGGWVWALLVAVRRSRRGMIAALIFSMIVALGGGLFTLLVFCGDGCAAWPVGKIIVWAELIAGLAASVALGRQLRGGPT